MTVRWHLARARRMSVAELVGRSRDVSVRRQWQRRWAKGRPGIVPGVAIRSIPFKTPLPAPATARVPAGARRRLLAAADGVLDGRWEVFGVTRTDMAPAPDWFLDAGRGERAPESGYCFDIDIRRGSTPPLLKPVWELSRHHHTTVLAAAYHVTEDERYAIAAAEQLRSWWAANPPLTGVNWTSGIEVGLRLVAWVWIRRLLDTWPDAFGLFDANPVFHAQLRAHQEYLAAFPSRGSSANNHLLAEVVGQFVAGCAFPYFEATDGWRDEAAEVLARELPNQTFPCGLNRELATAYHAFVLELGLAAALEGEVSDHSLSPTVWACLERMTDAAAAMVDGRLRPPRQGDDDEGRALLLDAPETARWASLLHTGEVLFGRAAWWPTVLVDDVRTPLWVELAGRRPAPPRAVPRPELAEAGMAILRTEGSDVDDELWCRCDHGPHGFLAIAAHAHADALAVELRAGGVEILADPGTFCYQGNDRWREYFRSTIAHNTLEIAGVGQSESGGPFLWTHQAHGRLEHLSGLSGGAVAEWRATHDGYLRLHPPALHRRTVRLDRNRRQVEIVDGLETTGRHRCRLVFHLGPAVDCRIRGNGAALTWTADGRSRKAALALPGQLDWKLVRGAETPLGWHSPAYGIRRPTVSLVGTGHLAGGARLVTDLRFLDTAEEGEP